MTISTGLLGTAGSLDWRAQNLAMQVCLSWSSDTGLKQPGHRSYTRWVCAQGSTGFTEEITSLFYSQGRKKNVVPREQFRWTWFQCSLLSFLLWRERDEWLPVSGLSHVGVDTGSYWRKPTLIPNNQRRKLSRGKQGKHEPPQPLAGSTEQSLKTAKDRKSHI